MNTNVFNCPLLVISSRDCNYNVRYGRNNVTVVVVKAFFISLFRVYFRTCHSVFKIEFCGRLGARSRDRRSNAG